MNLHRRLRKLESRTGDIDDCPTYDLRLLHPEEVDFIVQFAFRSPDDCALHDAEQVIAALLRACEIEPIEGVRTIIPVFPRSLQAYWRSKRFELGAIVLPRGNYNFMNLTFAEQAAFQLLSQRHGWDPEAKAVEIAPLSQWSREDVSELIELLVRAIPESEKLMWARAMAS